MGIDHVGHTGGVPGAGWIRGYRKEWFGSDVTAGLTAAAVVIPKAMAYATIAGLPLQVGLYTALVPMVIYALLGMSRPLSVSTTTTIAILSAAALGAVVPDGSPEQLLAAGATLALLVGAILVFAAIVRLGFVANFISEPVLVGFKSGIGLVIIVDQIPKLLGIHIHKEGFFRDILSIAEHLPQSSIATVLLAAVLFALIFTLEHKLPKAPAPLLAVAGAIAAFSLLHLEAAGVEAVGAVPGGLPSFVRPRLDLLAALWPAAVGIALMSFTESIAAARAFRSPGEPQLAPNVELFAVGLANFGGGVFGAMPAGGGTSQTAVNRRAGAKTQLSALITATATVAVLLFLAPLIGLMPHAALAAVVVAYSVDLIKPVEFAQILRVRRSEFYWAVIALVGVVFLGTLKGILVAVIASLASLAHQAYRPPVYALGRKRGTNVFRPQSEEHPEDESWPGLLILRTEGRIFFANAQRVGEEMRRLAEEAKPKVLLIDGSALTDLEYTALNMLAEGEERLRKEGTMLWLAALNPKVLEVIQKSRVGQALGRDRMFFNVEAAVEAFQISLASGASPNGPTASP